MTVSWLAGKRARFGLALVLAAAALSAALGVVLTPATGAKQEGKKGIGDHSFVGRWSFGADGSIERGGSPGRGFFEVGTFVVDGKGRITGGVEYSNMLADDDAVVDQPFTFEGTYKIRPDASGRARVNVKLPNGAVIQKSLWLVLNDIEKGEAHGFYGGHLHADLGAEDDGRAGLHHGRKVE